MAAAESQALGPDNPLSATGEPLSCPVELELQGGRLLVRSGDFSGTLAPGEWSPWVAFAMRASPLVGTTVMGRFHLMAIAPSIELYLSPLNLHPDHVPPGVPLSAPAGYASALAARHGHFKSIGWPTETWALTEERIDDATYLQDFSETFRAQQAIALAELARGDWDCFVAVFLPTDHIQHTFWRFQDPTHPRHDPAAPEASKGAILAAYQDADRFLGQARAVIDRATRLIVLSDHGFHSWRQAVNLNTWLVEEGLMALRPGARRAAKSMASIGHGLFFEDVDWFNTRAYSMGLGNIYLNRVGREPEGIVTQGAEEDLLLERIQRRLAALRDPSDGASPVRSTYRGRDIYHGARAAEGADLVVGFDEGYRVSWQTCLGGAPAGVFAVNDRKWSGDHCSLDPAITPGMVLSNQPLPPDPSIIDCAPSIVRSFGLPVPAEMDGRSWWA